MTTLVARHPDFTAIQRRLAALGLYPLAIDDEWGPGMAHGVDSLLKLAETAQGIPSPALPIAAQIPVSYGWLRSLPELPRHLVVALRLLGTIETPGAGNNPVIMGWRDELRVAGVAVDGYSGDAVPWCGLFMAYVMLKADRPIPKGPLWALNWGGFGVDGGQPELGDVLTFQREGGGHVALYIGEDAAGYYHVLGGNQSDKVSIMRIAKSRMRACRQPDYKTKPASVRPYKLAATGATSINEA